jgi:hypothetical protein
VQASLPPDVGVEITLSSRGIDDPFSCGQKRSHYRRLPAPVGTPRYSPSPAADIAGAMTLGPAGTTGPAGSAAAVGFLLKNPALMMPTS